MGAGAVARARERLDKALVGPRVAQAQAPGHTACRDQDGPTADERQDRARPQGDRAPLDSFKAESVKTATQCDRPGGHFPVGGPFHAEGPSDSLDCLVVWYNYKRNHMSPGGGEAAAETYARRMPPGGSRSRTSSRAYHTGASRRQQASTSSNQESPTGARGGGARPSGYYKL